ncbi:hypothetical protein CJF31_00003544 [Rutstroemia sp. NJR-2017a BVV2]|nr:hypothetical protein CJF31_00003544 [Rutstroemia sp. NJR-2017a BVV2]
MGNTSSSPNHRHESSRGIRDRCPSKRQSRTNSDLSDSTTSTSTSSPSSPSSPSSGPRSPSPRKAHRNRSLNASDNIRDRGRVDVEQVKTPIRMGYPYYEELMVPDKGGKKKKRRSFRS